MRVYRTGGSYGWVCPRCIHTSNGWGDEAGRAVRRRAIADALALVTAKRTG